VEKGCPKVLEQIANCNFDGVRKLWGWRDPHSTNNGSGATPFSSAGQLCQSADLVSFKTVDWGHHLSNWTWFLDRAPTLRIVDVVRDPRGVYASWKEMEPFTSLIKTGKYYTLVDVCEAYDENLHVHDGKVHHLVFENFVLNPRKVMSETYAFLGLHFGVYQEKWLKDTFDAEDCPPPPEWEKGFTDCHKDSESEADKWRSVLGKDELAAFTNSLACQRVAEAYGYPKS